MAEILDPAGAVREAVALLERGDVAAATGLARDALDRDIEAPLLLNLRAFWLEGQNRVSDALADLRRAHALAPSDPIVLNALGLCLAKVGKTEEAMKAFRDCAALAPQFGPAHFNAGWTAEDLGDFEIAAEEFEKAAGLMPQSADPEGRLAALAARRGRWDEARAHAAKALAIAPEQPSALIALTSADLAGRAFADAKARARLLLDAPNVTVQDRATAVGLLGDVLDAEGRYPEAFAAYAAGNTLYRELFAQRLALRPEMQMKDYVGWLLESFRDRAPWPKSQAIPPAPGEPSRHIFILGFPRSGTTLAEEVLACHPQVETTSERDAFAEMAGDLLGAPEHVERLRDLGEARAGRYRARYFQVLRNFGMTIDGRILIDKQPFNTIRLPVIAKLFPDARIVFALRDPRDVVLSCFRRRFAVNPANFEFLDLESAARLYDSVMRLAAIYRRTLPLEIHELRHEALVEDFEAEMRRLCAFAGIDWIEEFRDFASRSRDRQVSTPSATQIQRGLGREGIGHWRNYAGEMAPVLPLLNPWVETFNYSKA